MIIFDMDGTLWDTLEITVTSANQVVALHDELKPISKEVVAKGMGLNFIENTMNYMPYLDEELRIKYLNEINDQAMANISQYGTKVYNHVIDVIKELSKKYKLGIITNNNNDYIKTFLNMTQLGAYFTDYIGGSSFHISKAEALKIMTTRNHETVNYYVGDVENDKKASHQAGVNFIHARYGFGHDFEAKYYIDDIADLPELMMQIEKDHINL